MSTAIRAADEPTAKRAASPEAPQAPNALELEAPVHPPTTELLRLRDHLSLGSRTATFAYWCGVALVALSVFVPKLLPCTDYPQHLALADIARRLSDPSAPEQPRFWLNYFTYNGLFHVVVANLARLMPIELAGRVVVSSSLALLGGGVLGLVRALRRPAAYAALFTPIVFSFAVGWGFVNYALGTALAFVTTAFVVRALQRPTRKLAWIIAFLGLICAMAHVLAMLILCMLAASIAPEVALRAVGNGRPLKDRLLHAFGRSAVALSPLLLGAAWCIAVYRVQYAWDPVMYKDPTLEGSSPPLWQKITFFGAWGTGLHTDYTDQVLMFLGLAIALLAIVLRMLRKPDESEREATPPLWIPAIVAVAAYLLTPMVFIGTHLIFPRLAQAVVIGLILAAPAFPKKLAPQLCRLSLFVGILAGVNLIVHVCAYAKETDDASRVIDDAPPGRRATAVVWGSETFAFRSGTLVHLAAYYAARKHGDWSFSFARFLSVPIRFRRGGAPMWPLKGWEFTPSDYNPRCRYARTFDLVFVKAPSYYPPDDEDAVRRLVFKQDAAAVRLVSHHGAYWAFDSQGLPDDGTN